MSVIVGVPGMASYPKEPEMLHVTVTAKKSVDPELDRQGEQLGFVHDGHGELDLLLLPTGKLIQLHAGLIHQRYTLQILQRPEIGAVGVQALEPAEIGRDVHDRFLLVKTAFLPGVRRLRARTAAHQT